MKKLKKPSAHGAMAPLPISHDAIASHYPPPRPDRSAPAMASHRGRDAPPITAIISAWLDHHGCNVQEAVDALEASVDDELMGVARRLLAFESSSSESLEATAFQFLMDEFDRGLDERRAHALLVSARMDDPAAWLTLHEQMMVDGRSIRRERARRAARELASLVKELAPSLAHDIERSEIAGCEG
jgi:hypothetical protein